MPFAGKVVLHCPTGGNDARLGELVEQFIEDGVMFVAVVGDDCSVIEDIIDEIVVGDGGRNYNLLTSSHPGESLQDAVLFAESLVLDLKGHRVEVVEL